MGVANPPKSPKIPTIIPKRKVKNKARKLITQSKIKLTLSPKNPYKVYPP